MVDLLKCIVLSTPKRNKENGAKKRPRILIFWDLTTALTAQSANLNSIFIVKSSNKILNSYVSSCCTTCKTESIGDSELKTVLTEAWAWPVTPSSFLPINTWTIIWLHVYNCSTMLVKQGKTFAR